MSRVTVLVPNYNGGAYLAECLASVRRQTLEDWTLVVGDNASTDDSVSIVSSAGDPRIRLVQRPRTISWVANVNLLLAEADSDFIAILHADDWWEPEFLATLTGMLERAPKSIVAGCATRLVEAGRPDAMIGLHQRWPRSRGTTCPAGTVARLLTDRNLLPAVGVLTRSSLYQRFPRYEEALPLLMDWLMWLRAGTEFDFEVSEAVLANYRVHPTSLSAAAEAQNGWAIDLLRLSWTLEAEWSTGRSPYPGAPRAIAAAVAYDLIGRAMLRLRRGDTEGAQRLTRLAEAVAPTLGQGMAARLATVAMGLTARGPLAALRAPMLAAAARLRRAPLVLGR